MGVERGDEYAAMDWNSGNGVSGGVMVAAGCEGDSAEREKTIRDEAAKAAAEAKPKIEEAGRAVKAAVDGAKEGWENGKQKTVDLNAASEDELTGLPGVGQREARRIMAGRPYKDKHEW